MQISDDLRQRILISQAKSRMRGLINFHDNRDSEAISIAAQLICEEPHYASLDPQTLALRYMDDLLVAQAA